MRFNIRRCPHGLTLIELLVAVAVMAFLSSLAIPAFSSVQHNARLRGAAELLATELRLAQSESFKRQNSVSLNFRLMETGWCYGYSVASACDCRIADSCIMDGIERTQSHEQYPGVQLLPGVSDNRFSFQPQRGTVTAGNVTLTGVNGLQLRVVVSGFGRIRICTPSGPSRYSGYPVCT